MHYLFYKGLNLKFHQYHHLLIVSICSASTEIIRRKKKKIERRSYFCTMTRLSDVVPAYITSDIVQSCFQSMWGTHKFSFVICKLLIFSPCCQQQQPRKGVTPMDSTCCHLRFHPEALWFSLGSLFFLEFQSHKSEKKKTGRRKQCIN